jgi:Leucine-rich repeat (LRR) protein
MLEITVFVLGALRKLNYFDVSFNQLKDVPKEIFAVHLQVRGG